MPCATGSSDDDHPLPEEAAEETVLTEAEVQDLTERFLFGDPAGVKATGPTGAAKRATLRHIVVRKVLWPYRRPEINALLADEQGRFDQEELLHSWPASIRIPYYKNVGIPFFLTYFPFTPYSCICTL
jgi:hypothetical protein